MIGSSFIELMDVHENRTFVFQLMAKVTDENRTFVILKKVNFDVTEILECIDGENGKETYEWIEDLVYFEHIRSQYETTLLKNNVKQ